MHQGVWAAALVLLTSGPALAGPSAAEQASIFAAAGFAKHGRQWTTGTCDPPELSYKPGAIDTYQDLNGDGRPEAVVTEQGGMCYGNTGQNFWLLSKQVNGSWKLLVEATAIPEFLRTKGAGGYPDILMGGPGFCFPVVRWNGREYATHRFEYEGRPCRRER